MTQKSSSSFIRRVADSVTVEPVLVLFSLSQGIYMITSQTVYIDKVGEHAKFFSPRLRVSREKVSRQLPDIWQPLLLSLKVCRVNLGLADDVCSNLNYRDEEVEVEQHVAQLQG